MTARISGCWSHQNRGRRVSKSADGWKALYDWWGWFQQSSSEHVQATTILASEVVFKEIVNEPSMDDHFEESCAQIEFDFDLVPEQDEALLDSTPEIWLENGETTEILFLDTSSSAAEEEEKGEHLESVEHLEHITPPSNPNLSNDSEMSTEVHSFIIIPFETLHEPQASVLQCLKEPSYDKFVKDPCTQGHKSRNHHPKKILRSKEVGYLRWWHILPKGYQILKKKWWKGLVGHPNDQRRRRNFFYFLIFFSAHLIYFVFHFISCHLILFLTKINLLMFVLVRKYCC
jgi:hypothetical protein